jgi:hypothetical protein
MSAVPVCAVATVATSSTRRADLDIIIVQSVNLCPIDFADYFGLFF